MRCCFAVMLFLLGFVAWVGAEEPATKPSTHSATAPTTKSAEKFPTPAELLKRMKELKEQRSKLAKVAYFDLSQPILEKPADFSIFGDPNAPTLRSLIERLHMARDDSEVKGVLITISQPTLNLAQAQEIREALAQLRKAGKPTFVYADSYDTISYVVATGAKDICLLEGGELFMPGVGVETTFLKGLLDKIGVQADYVQIGEYKGADEQFTRTGPTEELRGELNKLMDALYEQIVDGISVNRNLSRDEVKAMIDETILIGPLAKERGFVDHLVNMEDLRELLAKQLGNEIDLLYDYGQEDRENIDVSNPFALFALFAKRPEPSRMSAVALIYAEGVIVDGEGGEGLFGGSGVGSADLRRALRTAARDDKIKAIVLRIDSPGGSALASEAIWQAARDVAEEKPLVISIGSMAASGGYYLASAGDHVFADPSAIVGSIGVVGGKFVLKGLYDKIGLTSETFSRGRNADLFSSNEPFNEREREMITKWMKQTYDQFTRRVMETRKGKIKDIDKVARGRIFIAKQALELGMVDELGGIEQAIDYAAKTAKMTPGQYDVRVLPAPKTLADLLSGSDDEVAMPFTPRMRVSEDSMLRLLPSRLRKTIGEQVQILQLLEERPVILTAPFTISIK